MNEENQLDPQTVYTITHEEIRQTAKTQCAMDKHRFRKISDNEVECEQCQTMLIVKDVNDYVAQ